MSLPIGLPARIAATLGWHVDDVKKFSLQTLRELVRPVSTKVTHEIDTAIRTGAYLARED